MENEDVILNQMEDTRTSLSEKLGTLEQQVASTVQGASTNVADTVEAVKDSVEAVKDTVEAVTDSVTDTVNSVKESVENTISSVKASVQEGFTAVKSAFDIPSHVRAHPWAAFGGSIAVGFFLERFVIGSRASEPALAPPSQSSSGGRLRESPREAMRPVSSPLAGLLRRFEPEIGRLKSLAVGAVLNAVREMVTNALPGNTASSVNEIIESVMGKISGEFQGHDDNAATPQERHRDNGRTHESVLNDGA